MVPHFPGLRWVSWRPPTFWASRYFLGLDSSLRGGPLSASPSLPETAGTQHSTTLNFPPRIINTVWWRQQICNQMNVKMTFHTTGAMLIITYSFLARIPQLLNTAVTLSCAEHGSAQYIVHSPPSRMLLILHRPVKLSENLCHKGNPLSLTHRQKTLYPCHKSNIAWSVTF